MKVNKDIIARDIQGDTVLLNMKTGDYFSLNAVGTDIYNCISEGIDNASIIDCLVEKYEVTGEQLKSDVSSLITELKENGIIEVSILLQKQTAVTSS